MNRLAVAFGLAFAACSVPDLSLDGKLCGADNACAPGYACDPSTRLCLVTNDAGMIVDGQNETCLNGSSVVLYQYTGGFVGWQASTPEWVGDLEIVQSKPTATDTYAYYSSTAVDMKNDYRVISTMRPVLQNNMAALGIALRVQAGSTDASRYQCMWSPGDKKLRIETWHGNAYSPLAQTPEITEPLANPFIMEAKVTGSAPILSCCVRGLAAAKLVDINDSAPGAVVPTGYPGLATDRAHTTFSSFTVYEP